MNDRIQFERMAVTLLKKILKIYSPSGGEDKLANFVSEQMKEMGYAVHIDEVGNVIGEIGKGRPTVLFASHLDTVSGFFPVRMDKDRIYGRGSVDSKGPFTAMLIAASRYVRSGGKGKVLVVGFVEEEKYVKGARHFTNKPTFVDYVVSGEASGVDRITTGYKGLLNLIISVYTTTGHSSAPKGEFISAIEVAFSLWNRIKEYTDSETVEGSQFRSLTSVLTHMSGGVHEEFTKVPGECHFEVNMRIPPKYTHKIVYEEIKKLIAKFLRKNPEVRVEVKSVEEESPFKISQNTPFVNAIRDAVKEIRKKDPEILVKTATGDINVIANRWNIPAVAYGPGNSHLGHAPIEYLEIKEYLDSILAYEKILEKLTILYKIDKGIAMRIDVERKELSESLEGKFLPRMLKDKGLPPREIAKMEQDLLTQINEKMEERDLLLSDQTKRALANVMLLVANTIEKKT